MKWHCADLIPQHQRDPNKSYLEQLQDFSKTPVGAAGWSGNYILPPELAD